MTTVDHAEPISPVALRMHHHEWVTADPGATRSFYEDLVGLPLVRTWVETVDFGDSVVDYVHTQYGLQDGSVLSFFAFAAPADEQRFRAVPPGSPFAKIALAVSSTDQEILYQRLLDDSRTAPHTLVLDHGYCRSLVTRDPNGLGLEFTVDVVDPADSSAGNGSEFARRELDRWLAGDRTSNNHRRP